MHLNSGQKAGHDGVTKGRVTQVSRSLFSRSVTKEWFLTAIFLLGHLWSLMMTVIVKTCDFLLVINCN